MRIIAGSWRGRVLAAPAGSDVRPTSDRVREALFSILASRLEDGFAGQQVLDLFCGTGALGLEALSRGAQQAVFIDKSAASLALVRRSLHAFGALDRATLVQADATRLPTATAAPATLVFADPPYAQECLASALESARSAGWIASGALVAMEQDARSAPVAVDGFELALDRAYARTAIRLFRADF